MLAALKSRSNSFTDWNRLRNFSEKRRFPLIHFSMRGEAFALEWRETDLSRRNNPRILRPQAVLGFVIVGNFHVAAVRKRIPAACKICNKLRLYCFASPWVCC